MREMPRLLRKLWEDSGRRKIEKRKIFARFGEERFREMEREFIENGHPNESCVISCGGGLVCRDGMPELLKSKGVVVVLFAEPEVIFKRVSSSNKRPLLNVENPFERIKELFEKRKAFYEKSGICVNSNGNIKDIEERIARIYIQNAKR